MKRIKLGIAVMSVLLSFFLITGGIVQAEDGVTNDEILIGSTMDLSGPLAFMGQSWLDGASLYFKHINDQGGIHGRKIKFLVEDDGFQAPRTVQAVKKLVTKDKVFCMSMNMGAAGIMAVLPFLEENKVPMLPAGTANEVIFIPPRKYVFVSDTSYRILGVIAVRYIRDTLKATSPKAGIIYQEDVTGAQWLTGVKQGFEKYYGIKDTLDLSYKRGAVDFSSQIAKCKQAGVTHVFIHGNVREPAGILKEAQRVQYKPVYFTNATAGANKVVELCGDAINSSNGFYLSTYGRDMGTENAGFKRYRELVKKYNMGDVDNNMNGWGFHSATILCEVLKRAGRDLTREGFIAAAETMTDFDDGMLVPVTWRSDRRGGGDTALIFKADQAKAQWVLLSDQWIGQ